MKSPCDKDCSDRSPTCHGKCVKYLEFYNERQKENEARHTYNSIMNDNEIQRMAFRCAARARRK